MPRSLVFCLAACLCCAAAAAAAAQTSATATIYSLPSGAIQPFGGLVHASDGNFYGASSSGGGGYGSIFRVTPAGTISAIYSFSNGSDGAYPAGLVEGPDGNLWGMTLAGSANGFGAIFKCSLSGELTPEGAIATGSPSGDGAIYQLTLTLGRSGLLYGTLPKGGVSERGQIFRIGTDGSFYDLYDFETDNVGTYPVGPVLETADGFEMGATQYGFSDAGTQNGFIWGLGSDPVYAFPSDGSSGGQPNGGLAAVPGNLVFGTTVGNIFSLTQQAPDNIYNFAVVHTFAGTPDGAQALSGLYAASDGNLYGVTAGGGAHSDGLLYQLKPSGTLQGLYSFSGGAADGNFPAASPIQDNFGNLWGTTFLGGADAGTVYEMVLSPALPAPVQLTLSSSTIGQGDSVTLNWKALNGAGGNNRQCYAFAPAEAGSGWTGLQTGTYNASTGVFSGAAKITTYGPGTYTYALTCGGFESGFAQLTVTPKQAITTTLTVSPSTTVRYDTAVQLTATLSGAGAVPTGTIKFYTGTTLLAGVAVTGTGSGAGNAMLNASATVPPGSYPVTAVYSGDGTYQSSTSAAVTVTVAKDVSAVTMTATPNPVTPPAGVTLTATVTNSSAPPVPTGKVTFYYQSTALGAATLNGPGVASFTASSNGLPAGNYAVHAVYGGDADHATATSATVMVTVK